MRVGVQKVDQGMGGVADVLGADQVVGHHGVAVGGAEVCDDEHPRVVLRGADQEGARGQPRDGEDLVGERARQEAVDVPVAPEQADELLEAKAVDDGAEPRPKLGEGLLGHGPLAVEEHGVEVREIGMLQPAHGVVEVLPRGGEKVELQKVAEHDPRDLVRGAERVPPQQRPLGLLPLALVRDHHQLGGLSGRLERERHRGLGAAVGDLANGDGEDEADGALAGAHHELHRHERAVAGQKVVVPQRGARLQRLQRAGGLHGEEGGNVRRKGQRDGLGSGRERTIIGQRRGGDGRGRQWGGSDWSRR